MEYRLITNVPIEHRFDSSRLIGGKANQYKKTGVLARKHRGYIGGGGYGFGKYYDMSVYIPEGRITRFIQDLKRFKIRFKNYGLQEPDAPENFSKRFVVKDLNQSIYTANTRKEHNKAQQDHLSAVRTTGHFVKDHYACARWHKQMVEFLNKGGKLSK